VTIFLAADLKKIFQNYKMEAVRGIDLQLIAIRAK
jgi:hypothetical protein